MDISEKLRELKKLSGYDIKYTTYRDRWGNEHNRDLKHQIDFGKFQYNFVDDEKCYKWIVKKIDIFTEVNRRKKCKLKK